MFDLDHFKQVNDIFGHEKGDEVLSSVGVTITSTLRASDFAGYGRAGYRSASCLFCG